MCTQNGGENYFVWSAVCEHMFIASFPLPLPPRVSPQFFLPHMPVTGMKSILHMAAFFNFAVQLLEMHRITHTHKRTHTQSQKQMHLLIRNKNARCTFSHYVAAAAAAAVAIFIFHVHFSHTQRSQCHQPAGPISYGGLALVSK